MIPVAGRAPGGAPPVARGRVRAGQLGRRCLCIYASGIIYDARGHIQRKTKMSFLATPVGDQIFLFYVLNVAHGYIIDGTIRLVVSRVSSRDIGLC